MIPTDFQFPDLNEVFTTPPVKPKRPLLTRIGTSHDFLLQLDNTTSSIMHTCPRASKYYTIERRQKPDRAPLIFGGAIHAGLEVVHKFGYEQEAAGVQALLNYFEQNPYNTAGQWRTPSYAVEAFRKYCSYWSLMDNLTPIGPDWVEKAFALNIGSFDINDTLPFTYSEITDEDSDEPVYIATLHVQWTGKIDIGAHNGDRNIWVVDHKTSSMGGPSFFADFQLAQQTHGYMWAMQEILGHPISGFILNALIIRQPTRTGKGIEFDRKTYEYSQESIVEWKQDMLHSVEAYVHALCNDAFPKYTSWCMGKYGACQYHDICTLPAAQRRFMLYSDYFANVTWSPLHGSEDEK